MQLIFVSFMCLFLKGDTAEVHANPHHCKSAPL
jgi:hypothetical protein